MLQHIGSKIDNTNDTATFENYIQKENVLKPYFKDIYRETRFNPILSKICEFLKRVKL